MDMHDMKTSKRLINNAILLSAASLLSTGAFAADMDELKELTKNLDFYGVIDFGATYVDDENGSSSFEARDSVNWGNRLGVKGELDLMPGYQAVFTLEHGFKLSDGETSQYGTTWGRQAFAGIQSDDYGRLTFGRQYDFIYDNLNMINIGGYATTYAGHHGDLDRISGWRVEKSIKYVSPNLNGWTLGAMYGSDGSTYAFQDTGTDETVSLGAKYFAGPWSFNFAYINIKDTRLFPSLTLGVSELLGQSLNGSGIVVDQETFGVGGHYQMGDFTLVGNTTQTELSQEGETATQNVYEIGGYYPLSESTLLITGYQHSKLEDDDWDQVTFGLKHDFTDYAWFYTSYSYLEASDGVKANQGAGWYLENSSDNTQQTLRVGMILAF